MFSSRLKWETAHNALSEALADRRRRGETILDLTESNPTRAGLDYPATIFEALADEASRIYRPDPCGLASAREEVARHCGTSADRIILTASTSEAYTYLFKLLCDPEDDVLVPRPSYPLFDYLASVESVHARTYPLRYAGEWRVDFEALEASLGPRTRAIIVVNPNNPTGSFLKPAELDRLESIAAARDIALISDEVFSDYVLQPGGVQTLAGERRALTFSMSGLSKVAGLPQMKLGWIVASGPRWQEAMERLEWIADTFLSVSTPVQIALPKLLEGGLQVQAQIRERTRDNLAWLTRRLEGTRVSPLHVEGGWYAVLQVPRTKTEEHYTLDLLNQHGVLVQPGYFFDFDSEAYLVVSLLTEPSTFRTGVDALAAL